MKTTTMPTTVQRSRRVQLISNVLRREGFNEHSDKINIIMIQHITTFGHDCYGNFSVWQPAIT